MYQFQCDYTGGCCPEILEVGTDESFGASGIL